MRETADDPKTFVDLFAAFGAHVQADAYRDSLPDDEKDAEYLRRQETWWRLKAREWAGDVMSERAAQAAKQRAEPEVKAAIKRAALSRLKDDHGR